MASLNPHCEKCPLHKSTNGTVCVAGEGPRDAEIMIIGEAPGAEEEKTGRPFMGQSGRILRNELHKNGLESVFITNTVRCRPPDNHKPSVTEMKACREYLDYELERIKPRFVVTLGATPTKALFTGKTKVTQHHGTVVEDPKRPYTGFISYHPAYTLHDPSKLPDFQADIARLARAVRGESRKTSLPWAIVRRGNLATFLREFTAAPWFSFDLETSGLFMHDPKGYINSIQIGLPGRTWVIPVMDYDPILKRPKYTPWRRGKALPTLMQVLAEIQKDTKKRAVGHNAKFDNKWLKLKCGMKFRLSLDTMLASHTLDENSDHDLKSLTRKHLDEPDYDLTTREKKGFVSPRKLYEYGARDAAYTLRLAKLFHAELVKDRELHRLFYKLVMPAARAFEKIELRGKYVNLERMDEIGLDLRSELVGIEGQLNALAGRKVNWNAPAQVAKYLYEDLELDCTEYTEKGAPSTSETAIIDLLGKHPAVSLLVKYRELSKFLSTYIIGLREFMVGNLLYISYKLHGTVTGRYSSRIHSIPRDGKIRNLVEAPPGWEFVQADISQAELRIIATLSGDLEMRRCFLEGIDIHWRTLMFVLQSGGMQGDYVKFLRDTAKKIYGEEFSISASADKLLEAGHEAAIAVWSGWKEARKKAKAVNFGYVYGMFEKKFIQTAKTKYGWEPTWDEAHSNREAYFHLYHGIPAWHSKQKKLCAINGYVRMLSGRRRRLPGIESNKKSLRMEAERQAINSPVQGFIGDYKAMCLVEIEETIPKNQLRVVGEHHDAILMIVKTEHKAKALPRVLQIIRSPALLEDFKVELDVPMDGEVEVGPWGAGKPWTESSAVPVKSVAA